MSTVTDNLPAHVDPELVLDFDWFDLKTNIEDVQVEWSKLRERAPAGIFWTPRNGGHWVPLRGEDIATVMSDYTRFSAEESFIPPNVSATGKSIPQQLNPPEHTSFRKIILPPFMPKNLAPLEEYARELTISMIEGFIDRGQCEFVSEFASVLPITVFFKLAELPLEDREHLQAVAGEMTRPSAPENSGKALKELESYLAGWLEKRRQEPGDDLLSTIATATVNGRKITDEEATLLATNMLAGGLDTVVNMLGFFAMFLAKNPEHRKQLIENPDLINPAVEELIRRHGMVANGRRIVQDTELSGAQLRAGDMILAQTMLHGTDESITPGALRVDFERAEIKHLSFGAGPHTCPGQNLARRELRVFLEEWLKRIPDFEIVPGSSNPIGLGHVAGLVRLELRWPSQNA